MSVEQTAQRARLALAAPDIVEHDLDILIIGGGMGACGAALSTMSIFRPCLSPQRTAS